MFCYVDILVYHFCGFFFFICFCGFELSTGVNSLLQLTSALVYLLCVLIARYISMYYSPNNTYAYTHIDLSYCFKIN